MKSENMKPKPEFRKIEKKYRQQRLFFTSTENQAFLLGLRYNRYRITSSHHRDYTVFKHEILKDDPNFKSLVSVVKKLNQNHIYITYKHCFWESYLQFCFQYAQKYFSGKTKYPPILILKSDKLLKAFEKYRAKFAVDDLEEVDLKNDKEFEEFNKKYYDNLRKNLSSAGFSKEEIKQMLND